MQRRSLCGLLGVGLLSLLVGLLTGCSDSPASSTAVSTSGGGTAQARRPVVVCTTTMIEDLARNLAGDLVEVRGIMRVGEDPHVYEARPRDGQWLAEADLVLYNGLHLEATLLHMIENSVKPGRAVALAEQEAITPLAGPGTAAAAADPHCWFNVLYFRAYAQKAADALKKLDPAHAAEYDRRASDYMKQLDELHAWVKAELETIPQQKRVLVTSHDAFRYYGQAYGVDVHAVIGISTEQQPRPQDFEQLEAFVRDHQVKAIFIETSVNNTLNEIVRKIAARTGAKIGGTLYSDSLGAPGSPGDTYIRMVQANTRQLVEAMK